MKEEWSPPFPQTLPSEPLPPDLSGIRAAADAGNNFMTIGFVAAYRTADTADISGSGDFTGVEAAAQRVRISCAADTADVFRAADRAGVIAVLDFTVRRAAAHSARLFRAFNSA